MLKLRRIGIRDYSVLEDDQRIGRIRLASERTPPIWLWTVTVHLTGGLPMGSGRGSRHRQGRLRVSLGRAEGQDHAGGAGAAAYTAMNIRDDG